MAATFTTGAVAILAGLFIYVFAFLRVRDTTHRYLRRRRRSKTRGGWWQWFQCTLQGEQPDPVAALTAEYRASGQDCYILFTFVFKGGDGRIDAGIGTKLPQMFAIALVERGQPAI